MRNPIFKVAGTIIGAAMFSEVWMQALIAFRNGWAFYGENYKWLPLGTYSSLAALTIVTVALVWLLSKQAVIKIRKRATRQKRMAGTSPGHDAV